jgi:aryl-alcohol dehydrogenase-like predicted oxidoreductase
MALSWVLGQGGVAAPIIGATKLEQLDQLVAGVDVELGREDLEYLQERYQPHRVVGH